MCLLTRCVPSKYLSGLVARYPTKLKPHFARYGITDTVVTDSGPQFSSREFADFATSNPQTPSERQDSKRVPDGSPPRANTEIGPSNNPHARPRRETRPPVWMKGYMR